MQNLYDNPTFHDAYRKMRTAGTGLNDVLEQPALRALLPPLAGLRILDVGCGFGDFCRFAAANGAAVVVGIDPSGKMIAIAEEQPVENVRYSILPAEELTPAIGTFDLVVSSLALHYVPDFADVTRRIAAVLAPGGGFLFSVEHPIATCGQGLNGGWLRDPDGRKEAWKVDHYGEEGVRSAHWYIDGVIKYHRTLATIINTLVRNGFQIEQVDEPVALPEAEAVRPDLDEERRRPPFLLVKSVLAIPPGEQTGAAPTAP